MQDFVASAASIHARWGDVDGNLQRIIKTAERAAEKNARLLLLPECSLTGAEWPTGEKTPSVEQVAIPLEHPSLAKVRDCARDTGVTIAVGFYEKLQSQVRITQALVSASGIAGVYRKTHNYEISSTDQDLFPVFDLGFARVGISICFDNMFPECARIVALKGAEVLLSPFTSLPLTREAWRLERLVALRSRAQDNRMFVLSASHAEPHVPGKSSEWGYSGICCAVNPLGEVIAESEGEVGKPQSVHALFEERVQRTYLLAHVPAIRARRAKDYAALIDGLLQQQYVKSAAPFTYDETRNRNTVEA